MKKLFVGVIAVSLAGVLSTQGYTCKVANNSPNHISVHLDLHGYVNWGPAGCTCCDLWMNIPPHGEDSRNTSACQLKRITVTEKVPADMSKLPKDTPQAIKGFLRGATNDVETSLYVNNVNRTDAHPDIGERYLRAYGDTTWKYNGPNQLIPVSGVDDNWHVGQ